MSEAVFFGLQSNQLEEALGGGLIGLCFRNDRGTQNVVSARPNRQIGEESTASNFLARPPNTWRLGNNDTAYNDRPLIVTLFCCPKWTFIP